MKLATIILSLFAVAVVADGKPAEIIGHGRVVDPNDAQAISSMHQLVVGARNLDIVNGRRLTSPLDQNEVLIKNVDCGACMEAPPPPIRKLRGNDERGLAPNNDVFVTALNCDDADPFQIWNLLSLEPTGNWFLMESVETGECMQLIGDCSPSGALYDIEMGPCEATNFKAFWGVTGIGEIVNYECLRSNQEQNNITYHSTPDIFLEAQCGNTGGKDYLGISSHSADSVDQAQNYWIVYPKSFGSIVPP